MEKYDCMLVRVKHSTVYELKALDDEELRQVLQELQSEMREIHRAVNWVEGVIRLKDIEKEKSP